MQSKNRDMDTWILHVAKRRSNIGDLAEKSFGRLWKVVLYNEGLRSNGGGQCRVIFSNFDLKGKPVIRL